MPNVRLPRNTVSIGFASRPSGRGVAYATIRSGSEATTACLHFTIERKAALEGRDVTYAAVDAVVCELRRRNLRDVELRLDDARLAGDLAERRGVPQPLVMPYVALRCALNRLGNVRITPCRDRAVRDCSMRALADISLDIAA